MFIFFPGKAPWAAKDSHKSNSEILVDIQINDRVEKSGQNVAHVRITIHNRDSWVLVGVQGVPCVSSLQYNIINNCDKLNVLF